MAYMSFGCGVWFEFLCIISIASPDSLSSFLVDRVQSFSRLNAENDLSHATLPTGTGQRIGPKNMKKVILVTIRGGQLPRLPPPLTTGLYTSQLTRRTIQINFILLGVCGHTNWGWSKCNAKAPELIDSVFDLLTRIFTPFRIFATNKQFVKDVLKSCVSICRLYTTSHNWHKWEI